ncbi:hypothetical protein [Aequorivita lipolytica]|uniref:Uncharacterized protein n=1 Tax=Aequorivita lipolytica TaxID=153267 RepID=A0A5C6YP96_9FLAO|nr:hypothetical protein [Aequorivita lipolytica]TXD69139.1 hypothetical protein ESV24_08845 [Aequorivita lipolytica]SRX51282.1 hypothetical protein AEQU2_01762 [Aequorivita lipolytica]
MNKVTFLLLFIMNIGFAQVGVGTLNPQAELDINGSLLVQQEFVTGSLPTVKITDENFKLLTRLTNSSPVGEIRVLNVDSLTVAPINVVNYRFDNIYLDNLTDVDLQYDANKYIVGVANFRYVGDAIKKIATGGTNSIGAFVVRTFIQNGTWHLEIRNRFLDITDGTEGIQYYVTFIIYDKSYFKNLPAITTNLNGSQIGVASSVPNL